MGQASFGPTLELLGGLRALQARHPDLIRDVRGVGLMIGLELDAPAGAAAALSRRCAAEHKLLLLPTSGPAGFE